MEGKRAEEEYLQQKQAAKEEQQQAEVGRPHIPCIHCTACTWQQRSSETQLNKSEGICEHLVQMQAGMWSRTPASHSTPRSTAPQPSTSPHSHPASHYLPPRHTPQAERIKAVRAAEEVAATLQADLESLSLLRGEPVLIWRAAADLVQRHTSAGAAYMAQVLDPAEPEWAAPPAEEDEAAGAETDDDEAAGAGQAGRQGLGAW